jgi:transposase InsO family protein
MWCRDGTDAPTTGGRQTASRPASPIHQVVGKPTLAVRTLTRPRSHLLLSTVRDSRAVTAEWAEDYNSERPHDSLGGRPPKTFMPGPETTRESSYELSR